LRDAQKIQNYFYRSVLPPDPTVKRISRHHYPHLMAVKMLIKPIPMIEPVKGALQWPLAGLALLISFV